MPFPSKQFLKSFVGAFRFNRAGKNINQKLVIIESDDWGAIRTPSSEALKAFQAKGLYDEENVYNFDALESGADLSSLFEVLSSFKGGDGTPARLTANVVVANPDFEKIRKSGYRTYVYEKWPETFDRYPNHRENLGIWKEGIAAGVSVPQFHGREHLNTKRWLKALQTGDSAVRFCFDWRSTYSGEGDYSFMEAFDWDLPQDVTDHVATILDGLRIFEEYFGFEPRSFIAPCYNWDAALEEVLAQEKVRILQGVRNQREPTGAFGKYRRIPHVFGESNRHGQYYNIRNCFFEPASNRSKDWVDSCMAQISSAFLFRKPAVICSHRVNYIGAIEKANRDRGLAALARLLHSIVTHWPDTRFVSTDQLVTVLPAASGDLA